MTDGRRAVEEILDAIWPADEEGLGRGLYGSLYDWFKHRAKEVLSNETLHAIASDVITTEEREWLIDQISQRYASVVRENVEYAIWTVDDPRKQRAPELPA